MPSHQKPCQADVNSSAPPAAHPAAQPDPQPSSSLGGAVTVVFVFTCAKYINCHWLIGKNPVSAAPCCLGSGTMLDTQPTCRGPI